MNRFFALIFLLFFVLTAWSQNVFYGERQLADNKLALYFDKDGFPYPDHPISDSSMRKAGGSLFSWFLQNSADFIEISAAHQLFPEKIDRETIFRLRDSITSAQLRKINKLSVSYAAVTFYIHGFRKSFVAANKDVTSVEEFALLKMNLATYTNSRALEVEVYWDGMYDCCFSAKRKKNRELFRMLETAATNAKKVGLGLRPFLTGTRTQKLQLVAHSLGSLVAVSALFAVDSVSSETPSQPVVNCCFIAPAIDAATLQKAYGKRNSGLDTDNYHLLVVYNEKDYVLRKKDPKIGWFGPGAGKFGCTSLGCNKRKEAEQLPARIAGEFPGSDVKVIDKTSLGKYHSLRFYAKDNNLKEVSDFLWK